MKNRYLIGALTASFVLMPGIGLASSVSYTLDVVDIFGFGNDDFIEVTIDDEGTPGDINFTVDVLAPYDQNTQNNFGVAVFGFNVLSSATASDLTSLPTNWSAIDYDGNAPDNSVLCNSNVNGYGCFDIVLSAAGGPDRIDPLTFSITGVAGDTLSSYVALSLEDASDPFEPLIAPYEGVSLFAAKAAGMDTNLIAGGSAQFAAQQQVVPVPAAAWLFGSGLIGLLGIARRKKA